MGWSDELYTGLIYLKSCSDVCITWLYAETLASSFWNCWLSHCQEAYFCKSKVGLSTRHFINLWYIFAKILQKPVVTKGDTMKINTTENSNFGVSYKDEMKMSSSEV